MARDNYILETEKKLIKTFLLPGLLLGVIIAAILCYLLLETWCGVILFVGIVVLSSYTLLGTLFDKEARDSIILMLKETPRGETDEKYKKVLKCIRSYLSEKEYDFDETFEKATIVIKEGTLFEIVSVKMNIKIYIEKNIGGDTINILIYPKVDRDLALSIAEDLNNLL